MTFWLGRKREIVTTKLHQKRIWRMLLVLCFKSSTISKLDAKNIRIYLQIYEICIETKYSLLISNQKKMPNSKNLYDKKRKDKAKEASIRLWSKLSMKDKKKESQINMQWIYNNRKKFWRKKEKNKRNN